MRNIAIFGQMYAGKSTLAAALIDAGYHRLSFAGPLKNVAALAYGPIEKTKGYDVVRDTLKGPDWTLRVSGREILQGVGQTIKAVDRDFWLKCFIRDAVNYADTPLVVDDGRFLFEFRALRDVGWLTVGLNTAHVVRMQRAVTVSGREPTKGEQDHESEIEVPDILNHCDIILQGTDDPFDNAKRVLSVSRKGN